MCGINGIIQPASYSTSLDSDIATMNRKVVHRGPDDDGVFTRKHKDYQIGMGMRRLSIIDLQSGSQPMYSADRTICIVFNGEIYNYPQLRISLEKKGIEFNTVSDTEVVLKLYEYHGTSAFSKLDGMFAVSIYDANEDVVLIARDFFGEKPLYFMKDEGRIMWASELKSLDSVRKSPAIISKEGLNLYFQLTYIPAPFTIYKNIQKLEANSLLHLDCKTFEYSISTINHVYDKYNLIDKKSMIALNHDMVQESVASRSISDVPLGTFLSGGVDSSIVSLCLAKHSNTKIDTFSIGFENKAFDETEKSTQVAKLINSNHHKFIIDEKDLSKNLDRILLNFDEPFADSSALATYVVAEKSSQHLKVALTGDGGDEVYGGYNKHYMASLNRKYTKIVPSELHRIITSTANMFLQTKHDNRGKRYKIRKFLSAINYKDEFYYDIISLAFKSNEISRLLQNNWLDPKGLLYFKKYFGNNNKTLSDVRNIDRKISLEGDMLVKVDRTSMLSSLECRAPFLNKRLWNFTSQLPEKFLLNGWDKKHLLKESFKQYFPKGFLDKPKKGFGVPVGDWLRNSLKKELKFYSSTEFLEKQGIFNPKPMQELIANHLSASEDSTFKVWAFFCFQKWYTGKFMNTIETA